MIYEESKEVAVEMTILHLEEQLFLVYKELDNLKNILGMRVKK